MDDEKTTTTEVPAWAVVIIAAMMFGTVCFLAWLAFG